MKYEMSDKVYKINESFMNSVWCSYNKIQKALVNESVQNLIIDQLKKDLKEINYDL